MKIDRSTRHYAPQVHLNAYIDGELPIAKRRVLERLLVADAALRSQVDELAEVRALVRLAYRATMTG
jgi:anti-sigma factor RsiW